MVHSRDMTELEKKTTSKAKKLLEAKVGGFWIKIHGGPMQLAGIPDLIGVCHGFFFGIEMKRRSKPRIGTDRQEVVLELIRQAGGCGFVSNDPDHVLETVVDWLLERVNTSDEDGGI